MFSSGGRETLLKAVIQAIPTYAMNLFRLPARLIKEIHRLCSRFWWGGDDSNKKMHWCSWERLCWHKADGGMGFRDLSLFNKALLAKQAWRLYNYPSSLAARVMKGLYYSNGYILLAKGTNKSSFLWRSILWGRELFLEGSRWVVGDGSSIHISKDVWIPKRSPARSYSFCGPASISFVKDLKCENGSWNYSLIDSLFDKEEANQILSIPVSLGVKDRLIWHFNSSGEYSVKSGYWNAIRLQGRGQVSSSEVTTLWWRTLWGLAVPPKVKVFMWKASLNWIPTQCNLAAHGIPLSTLCPICESAPETSFHALWGCKSLKSITRRTLNGC